MKRTIRRLQHLSQKAAQFKQAVESVPPKAAEIRETILSTAAQLKQIGAEVQGSVSGLKADSDERLIQAMHEVNGSADVFRQAGFQLAGADVELGFNQRLIVHLDKFEDPDPPTLRALIEANKSRATIHALLSAIVKAQQLADNVEMSELTYQKLIVHVGAVPTVRICWRGEPEEKEFAVATQVPAAQAAQPAASAFTQSSFFERRPAPEAAPASAVVTVSAAPSQPAQAAPAASAAAPVESQIAPAGVPAGSDWRRDALDRFKKMPDLSKHRR